ncbi:hypothetical protein EWI61_14450 [Methylolobus aquaticus]|nr:hypothetical protein EWI61_14450 [Methylolobus aquaticus]
MNGVELLPVDRFRQTLEFVGREAKHLEFSQGRLFQHDIDAAWVQSLEQYPELGERLEAFVSRFGRMQDTIADKLLPRWLLALAETPGSLIEVLNRAERLGVVESTERWLQARKLRNRLIHEYMVDPAAFAADLHLAREFTDMLLKTYARIREFAEARMQQS